MEIVMRTIGVYIGLLMLFRLMGKRSMSDLSALDFILFLIMSEALQNALVDDDKSVVMGLTVVLTFVMVDLGVAVVKKKYDLADKIAEGVPLLLVDHGRVLERNIAKTHIRTDDILQTARNKQGLERMSQIKYAVLETSGGISIIPAEQDIEDLLDRKLEALMQRLSRR
jgi:uncharacterized membrane protein YcaP (DUF421 family)